MKCYRSSTKLNRKDALLQEDRVQLARDGDRWKYRRESWMMTANREGKLVDFRTHSEVVYPGKGRFQIGFEPSGTDIRIMAYVDELPEAIRREAGAERILLFLTGHLSSNGSRRLLEILKESTLELREVKASGMSLKALEAKGQWGRHAVWLDPSLGFMPRRVSQSKEQSDWFNVDQPIGSMKIYEYEGAKLNTLEQVAEATKIEQIAGRPVVTAFKLEEKLGMVDGNTITRRFVVELSDVNLDPDFVTKDHFVASKAIPNGTQVTSADQPNIVFEWQDGKIVKSINQDSVENLDRLRFNRARWWNRGKWVVGGLIIVAIIGLFGLYMKRRGGAR